MPLNIHYVSGSRADFGLMRHCLCALRDRGRHKVEVVVTGQHMVARYGDTSADIIASGLPIRGTIPVALSGAGGAEMALAMADELRGMVQLWEEHRPDLVLLLGDRGEMLAGALAAVHLGIHIGHIGGGERSGTLDESFRHAVSKLSHFHFPTTAQSHERLVRMGEDPAAMHMIGAPGLVGLTKSADRKWLLARFALPKDKPAALTIFHPVVQEAEQAAAQMHEVIRAVSAEGFAQIVLRPNSDAGGAQIDALLDTLAAANDPAIRIATHLDRDKYCRVLASVDLMAGNSSSGIIESASFGVPCVNIGNRQTGRERNTNTVDAREVSAPVIAAAVRTALLLPQPFANIYGDGRADIRLVEAISHIDLSPGTLSKQNCY